MIGAIVGLLVGLEQPVLTLERAMRAAELQQPLLRQARAQHDAAEARIDEARAPLFPQVTSSASYERTTGNRILRIGVDPRLLALQPQPTAQMFDSFRADIVATQLVYDFGQTYGQFTSAQAAARAQAQTERAYHLSVVCGVRLGYFAALARQRLLRVAQQSVENQKRHFAQVEGFVQAHARPAIDLAQARLDVANAELLRINAQNAYDNAKAELNQAMGTEQGIDYDIEEASLPVVPGEDGPAEPLVAQAMGARPEFAGLREQTKAAEALVGSALGGYGPALTVSAGATEAGTQLDRLRWNYYGRITLSWTLFQGMATPARVAEARANVRSLEAQVDGLRLRVRLDVDRARISVQASKAALATAARAVESADERLGLAEGRYGAGVGNALELGDALLAQAAAAAQEVQSEYMLSAARAQLLLTLGQDGVRGDRSQGRE